VSHCAQTRAFVGIHQGLRLNEAAYCPECRLPFPLGISILTTILISGVQGI
jgi:hypothetical protein